MKGRNFLLAEEPENLNDMLNHNRDLWYKEHDMLREELNNMKRGQTWLINGSVATTGILLQLTRYSKSTEFVYLLPLIVLLPAWCLFFDKAISIHRIVGYLKVLEKIIVNPALAKKVIGWENALVIFRGVQQLRIRRHEKNKHKISSEHKKIYPQKSIRFLWICQRTFLLLTSICIFASTVVVINKYFLNVTPKVPSVWTGDMLAALLTVIAGCILVFNYRNEKYLKYLSWGRYSYRANEFLWKQILLKEMILEPERLLEYANDGEKIKRSDFNGVITGLFKSINTNYLLKTLNHEGLKFKESAPFEKVLDDLPRKMMEHQKERIRNILYNKLLPWRSKVLNFEGHNLDFSDYTALSITLNVTPRTKESPTEAQVMFQLLNNLASNEVNSTAGLCDAKYTISMDSKELRIPLKDFKNAHSQIHLDKICRLAIHFGQYAFGEKINETNNVKIHVESMTLVE